MKTGGHMKAMLKFAGLAARLAPVRSIAAACMGLVLPVACATAPGADAPTAEAPNAAPLGPVIDPGDILGKSPSALDLLLGEPSLTRREGPGEFRRYAMGECMLIVILYPDENGEPRVAHLDAAAQTSGGQKPAVEDCLAGVG